MISKQLFHFIRVMSIIYFSNNSLYIQLSESCLLYIFPTSPCTFNYQSHVYYTFFQQVPVHSTISVMFIIYFSNKSLYIQLSVSCVIYLFPTSPCTFNYQCHVYYIFFQHVHVHSTIKVMFIIYFSNKSLYIQLLESCLLYMFPTSPCTFNYQCHVYYIFFPTSPCTFNYQCHVYYIFFQPVPVHSTTSVMYIIYFSNKSLYIQPSVSCLLYIFPTSPCTFNYQCHVYYIFFPTSPCTFNYQCHVYYIFFQQVPVHSTIRVMFIISFFQQVTAHSTISVMFIIYFSNKSLYIQLSVSCVLYIFPTSPCTFNYQCHVYYIFFPTSPCTFNYQCHVYYIFFQQVPVHSTISVMFIIYFFQQVPAHSTISVMFIIYFSNKSLHIQLSVSCLLYLFSTSPCTFNNQCHVYYIFFQQVPVH